MDKKFTPLWLWPNTLSLDAPLVAVAWVWMLKEALGISYIESGAIWVLFAAVWCIYVVDRIADVWLGKRDFRDTVRHRFSWKYRWVLLPIVALVSSYCVYYTMYFLPATMLSAGIAAIFTILLYALMIPFQVSPIPYSKNLAAGMIFAFGVAIPARLYQSNTDMVINDVWFPLVDERIGFAKGLVDTVYNMFAMTIQHIAVVIGTIETVTFGVLCMLNITAIDLWENARKSDNDEVKATNELILTMGVFALVGFCLIYSMFWAVDGSEPYYYAVMAACGVLQVINRTRSKFTLDGQRVLADVALIAPIPLFFLFSSNT